MDYLDVRRLIVLTVAGSMLFLISMLLIGRIGRDQPAIRAWIGGALQNAAGLTLIGMRSLVPDWASIIVGNVLCATGVSWLYFGLRLALGLGRGPRWDLASGLAVAAGTAYFSLLAPNLGMRIVLVSAVLSLLALACAGTTLLSPAVRRDPDRASFAIVGLAFLAYATAFAIRAIATPLALVPDQLLQANAPVHRLAFAASLLLDLTLMFGLSFIVGIRTERSLRATAARFRATFEQASVGLGLLDLGGRWQRVNRKLATILDRGMQELETTPLADLLHPDDARTADTDLRRMVAGRANGVTREERFIRPDGTVVWVRHSTALIRARNGEPDHFVSLIEDIGLRKEIEAALRQAQSEALVEQDKARRAALSLMEDAIAARVSAEQAALALREREARYRDMFQANPHPMWVYDAESLHFLDVNDAAVEQYGYSRSDFLAMTARDVCAPGETTVLAALPEDSTEGNASPAIQKHRGRDGKEMMVEVVAHRITYLGRESIVVLAHDISARLRAEEQLRKLSLAVDQSPIAVLITDISGAIEYVNEAFIRTTGYERGAVLGANPKFLQSGKTPAATYQDLWQTLSAGRVWHGEFHNRRRDGREFIEAAIISPIRQPDGRITHYVASMEDITERKRTAAELDAHRHRLEDLVNSRTAQLTEARRRADAANAAKSVFLANMSHEIRTPMNAIIGLSHLLQTTPLSDSQKDRLGKIDGAAHHLLAIINDILDLSKIEAGHMRLESTDFSLQDLMEETRSLIAEAAMAKGLAVDVEIDAAPPWLFGDPTRLRQGLLNYATNAVKFTEHGRIALRASLLLEEGPETVLLRFEVEDTGIGIAAERHTSLFEAFEQADVSTTRKYGGTGLGLTITRHIARLMGGEAGFDSTPGRGSRFWFTARLLRGRAPEAADSSPSVGAAPGASPAAAESPTPRILVAEDNPINSEVALELLRAAGYDADLAADGIEAVERAGREHFDLILMDMQMPRLDGIGATRAIRGLPGHQRMPILAMTANAFDEDRQACLAAGMNDFVSKPVDPQRLYAVLRKWLQSGGSAPPA